MRRILTFPVLGLAALLTGCQDFGLGFSGDGQRYHEDFHYQYDMHPGSRLEVENINGSVEIVGWEKDQIEVNGTKYASTEDDLKALTIHVDPQPGVVRIRTEWPNSSWRGSHGARYIIRVPQKTELARIASSNGAVRAESLQGSARLKTSNGSIKALRLTGDIDAQTSNASIELRNTQGGAVLRSSNGSITADEVQGHLEATTSNSSVRVRLVNPEPRRMVRLESSNGALELTMDRWSDTPVVMRTSNSSITLHVPNQTNAQLRAHTSNGGIHSEVEVLAQGGTLSKNSLEGKIGNGGPELDLHTSNGTIRLVR